MSIVTTVRAICYSLGNTGFKVFFKQQLLNTVYCPTESKIESIIQSIVQSRVQSPCFVPTLLSVCMFMYKCHLMLISVNTVYPTFILHGARVQGNFTTCSATVEVSCNFRYMDNNSMAILVDVKSSQKLGV